MIQKVFFILLSDSLTNHQGQVFIILNSSLERVTPSLTGPPKPELCAAPYPLSTFVLGLYCVTSTFLDRLLSRGP